MTLNYGYARIEHSKGSIPTMNPQILPKDMYAMADRLDLLPMENRSSTASVAGDMLRELAVHYQNMVPSVDSRPVSSLSATSKHMRRAIILLRDMAKVGVPKHMRDTAESVANSLEFSLRFKEAPKPTEIIPIISIESEDPERDRTIIISVGGKEVFSTNYDAIGWSGMEAIENCVKAISTELDKSRIIEAEDVKKKTTTKLSSP